MVFDTRLSDRPVGLVLARRFTEAGEFRPRPREILGLTPVRLVSRAGSRVWRAAGPAVRLFDRNPTRKSALPRKGRRFPTRRVMPLLAGPG